MHSKVFIVGQLIFLLITFYSGSAGAWEVIFGALPKKAAERLDCPIRIENAGLDQKPCIAANVDCEETPKIEAILISNLEVKLKSAKHHGNYMEFFRVPLEKTNDLFIYTGKTGLEINKINFEFSIQVMLKEILSTNESKAKLSYSITQPSNKGTNYSEKTTTFDHEIDISRGQSIAMVGFFCPRFYKNNKIKIIDNSFPLNEMISEYYSSNKKMLPIIFIKPPKELSLKRKEKTKYKLSY